MNLNYKRKHLIKIIKARKKRDYEFLFDECVELLSSVVGKLQEQKNFDFDECHADFFDCSHTNELDYLLQQRRK
tara:strand:+ start:142 stop:363 length:222 start_codon:yes stop_codon:yes gene_type:complete